MTEPQQEHDDNPPGTLYKYFPPERIDALGSLELRFSPPTEFNDTFDTHSLVRKSEGAQALATRMTLRMRLGVLCLTEQPDNHLMWVHYTQNHTGFVLGFDSSALFFRDSGRTIRKVRYRRAPKVFGRAEYMNACFHKSDTWEYECEWRCVRKFTKEESRFAAIEPSLITRVIFGSKMAPWHISQVMQIAENYDMTHIEFLLASPSRKHWTIQIRPQVMEVCDKCQGNGYLKRNVEPSGTDA